MTINVVQLPYQEDMELLDCYRQRLTYWREHRRWLVKPVPIPPIEQRTEIATWQQHSPDDFERTAALPLFAYASRRAS